MRIEIKYIQDKSKGYLINYTQFILSLDNEIISSAFCSDYIEEDDPLLKRYMGLNLQSIETNERYRGKGYASDLLNYIIS